MIRRLVLLAAVVVASSGCTVQQYLAWTGVRTVSESPATVNGQPSGDLAYYDRTTRTVHLDPKAIAATETEYPGTTEWAPAHEYGHAIADDIGLHIGNEPIVPGAELWPPDERAAQCVAEVELGHGPPWTDDADGYWDCGPRWVAYTKALMAQHGIEVAP